MKPALIVLGAKAIVQSLHDRKFAATIINDVDLSKVPDGTFSGSCDVALDGGKK